MRLFIVLNSLFVILLMDWLSVVRGMTGNLILIDELIAISPVLVASLMSGRFLYTIDHIRSFDANRVVGQSGWRFAWCYLCMDMLLMILPGMLFLGLYELIYSAAVSQWSNAARYALLVVGGVLILLVIPLLMRLFLFLRPMSMGETRDRLEQICRRHRVRIRDILIWSAGGSVLNAVVIGFLGRLRYIVLTDSLLRLLPERYTEAVMAHEVAHIRLMHLPWLLGAVVSMLLVIEALLLPMNDLIHDDILVRLVILSLAFWLIFGWVSRRFEWQADAFAAVHLTDSIGGHETLVSLEATTTVINSLYSINSLNGSSPGRYSWRHGSTSLRCRNLQALVGLSTEYLPIDRVVFRAKLIILLSGLIATGVLVWNSVGAFE